MHYHFGKGGNFGFWSSRLATNEVQYLYPFFLSTFVLKFKATTKQYQPIKRRRRHGIQRQSLQGTFMVNNNVLTLRKNVSQRLISSELFYQTAKKTWNPTTVPPRNFYGQQ